MTPFLKRKTIMIRRLLTIYKVLAIALILSISIDSFSQNENNFEIGKSIDIYASLLKELNLNYVDSVDTEKIFNASVKALLQNLDPYTIFVSEKEVEDFEVLTRGAYGGIGVAIHQFEKRVVVSNVYSGFTAHKAGMKIGDVFLKIDSISVVGKTSSEVSDILKDMPGKPLTVSMQRPGIEGPIELNLIRETIKIKNVPYYGVLKDNIGYIILTGFTENAAKEFRNAFQDLKKNHKIESLILDLRGNGGGIINEAADILSLFIPRNTEVVKTKGKIKEQNLSYKTRLSPIDKKIPIVVLVDNSSASSSEIVAGALQDLDRAVIMGQRTFGKGLVQHIKDMQYNTKVKLTVAKYYIPSGRCIQEIDYKSKNVTADSTKVYLTKGGREVKGGKGIAPDITTKKLSLSNVGANLYARLLIFNFVTEHYKNTESIGSIKDFEVTEEIYKAFLNYIEDKDFTYTTESERSLKRFKKHAEKEKYFEAVKAHLEELEKAMKADKDADLLKHSDEIKKLLFHEIVSRYYLDEGRIQASLKDDPATLEAIKLLLDTEKYQEILQAKN
ncbi:MAG: peptidase S41 [Bacteroidetes bacterium]|nr:peptidase S41 [Bacteroidota bacterium]